MDVHPVHPPKHGIYIAIDKLIHSRIAIHRAEL
jgi:hypothetical protein